tara:strand:+ start:102360 stop:102662 length:303 start_codon:yes stop_codon:yes gene_type:complete
VISLPAASVGGFRTVEPDEATALGLPALPHGLILVALEDGSRWCYATADMEFFAQFLAAHRSKDLDLVLVVLHSAGAIWRLIFEWPEVGFNPDLPDTERN